MATKTTMTLVDDLDGTAAEETVGFGLDGVTYEIDLSAPNAAALREAFSRWQESARRTGGRLARGGSGSARPGKPEEFSREDREKMREWARQNGWPSLSSRGRVPDEVMQRWADAGRPTV